MNITRLILAASALLSGGICAQADTLDGNGSWQSWSPTVLNTSTSGSPTGPYWNGASGDGPKYNIGWCLTGTGNCHLSTTPGALTYYGSGNSPASNMYFTSSGIAQEVSLLGLFTNQNGVPPSGTDYFGWYSLTSNGTVGTMTALLNSNEAIGTTATFDPTTTYGFYLENVQSPNTSYTASYFWLSNDALDYTTGTGVNDTGTQHFSIFGASGSSSYVLGIEDTPAPTSDFDYNDMIIGLQPAPEPMTLTLVGAGIGLLGFVFRRNRT